MSDQDKWIVELGYVKKYINNDYLYKLWKDYKFPNIKLDGKDIELDSNINVYESVFISLLIEIYIEKYKPIQQNDKSLSLNFMEIGLAYGTSTITILNKIIASKYKNKINYDIIDMNQTKQWKDIGMKNISNFIKEKAQTDKQTKEIDIKLHQDSSTIILPKLTKKYDISFIDGSHAEDIVIQDFMNTHKLLKIGGLIIIDDILHKGVKDALKRFYDPKIYKIVYINSEANNFTSSKLLYDKNRVKRNVFNPNSMMCLQKLSELIPDITKKNNINTNKKKADGLTTKKSRKKTRKNTNKTKKGFLLIKK